MLGWSGFHFFAIFENEHVVVDWLYFISSIPKNRQILLRTRGKVFISIKSQTLKIRVGNSLFRTFALSLKIAHFKEWPCAIRSCCSLKKSDRERIALVYVFFFFRAIMSESLSALFEKERCHWFALESLSKNERFAQRKSYYPYVLDSFSLLFPLFMPKSELPLLFKKMGKLLEKPKSKFPILLKLFFYWKFANIFF